MNYTATITTDNDKNILKLFTTEDKEFQNRAEYKIREEKNKIIFEVTAKDAVSLRAATNAIIKTLIIYEKTK